MKKESAKLSFFERLPPYAAVATADLAGVPLELAPDPSATKDSPPSLKLPTGEVLDGLPLILKYLARCADKRHAASAQQSQAAGSAVGAHEPARSSLYGATALDATQADQWLDFIHAGLCSGPQFEASAAAASEALTLRTHMVGHTLSIADLAAWSTLLVNAQWVKVKKAPAAANLLRWFDFISSQPAAAAALAKLNPKPSLQSTAASKGAQVTVVTVVQATAKDNTGTGGGASAPADIALPNAVHGKVVTRFPPEPSGYLHIGHAKAALLNQHFADKYDGRMLVRFDDTNPSKESTEFVDNIVDDMQRLGLRYDKITYTSDYFPQMIDCAKKMIAAGNLYADDTDVDTMRDERLKCVESKRRGMDAKETARVFDEMIVASEEGRTFCLRVRMDMASDNACLRDPVMFRCNDHPHWRTGTTWKCYPTYDFACPFVDALEGVTHALRTSEYRDREEQYQRILTMQRAQCSELPPVTIWDYSRLNFVHTVLSKRKLQKLVDSGIVRGWTDPRFPTVQGILRRGLTLQALRDYIVSQGASKNTTLQEWDKIWTINKKVIDPVVPRHTAVLVEGKVPVTLSNGPASVEVTTIVKHKKNADAGKKSLYQANKLWLDQEDMKLVKEGEEVTLMDWGNAILRKLHTDGASGHVTAIDAELHLAGDFKKTKTKLSWLADVPDLVPLRLVELGHLITKPKLEEEDVFEDHINRDSWIETRALGDPNMRCLQTGDVVQLERKGFYRMDAAQTKAGQPLLLLNIPDGHSKGKKI